MSIKIKLLALAVVLSTVVVAFPVFAQAGATPFDWIVAKQLTVQNALEVVTGNLTVTAGDVSAGDDLTVADDATVTDALQAADLTATDDVAATDDLTVGDDATVTGDMTYTPGSAETIGYDEQIDPTGTYHKITAAAARGTDNIAAGTAGDLLILQNVGSNTITLTDTGTLLLSGNAALGQYDTVILLADGTNWIQISPEGDN